MHNRVFDNCLFVVACVVVVLTATDTMAQPPEPLYEDAAEFDPGGTEPFGLALGYIDNDNLLDLVVADTDDHKITVFLNTGDWDSPSDGFQSYDPENIDKTTRYPLPSQDCPTVEPFVALGDLDRDGDLDIVVTFNEKPCHGFALFTNDGNGGFGPGGGAALHRTENPRFKYFPRGVVIADLDNDSWPDVVMAATRTFPEWIPEDPKWAVLLVAYNAQTGYPSFRFKDYSFWEGTDDLRPYDIAVAEFAGDTTLLDVAMTDNVRSELYVGINDGNRQFTTSEQGAVPSEGLTFTHFGPAAGAYTDLVLTKKGFSQINLYANDGFGNFSFLRDYELPENSEPRGIATGMLNDDVLPDVATALMKDEEGNAAVAVFINSSLAADPFTPESPYAFPVDKPVRITVGDVNNDGMDDIVTTSPEPIAGPWSGKVSVLIQRIES